MIETMNVHPLVIVVEGGSERMFSIKNALAAVPEDSNYVAVHDAVRPFLSVELFDSLVDTVKIYKAVIPGIGVTDTIKVKDDFNFIESTPNRDKLVAVQTPQIFSKSILIEAYENAIVKGFMGTDDASLVELSGHKIRLVAGDPQNFKITWPDDIAKAEKIINRLK